MKRLGCLLGSVGVMLVAAAVFLFGAAIAGLARSPEALTFPIALESLEPIVVSVPPRSHRRLACRMEIATPIVHEEATGQTDQARFRFPISYVVRAGDRTVLAQGDARVAWDGHGTWSRNAPTTAVSQEATLTAEETLATCTMPSDGALSVTLLLGPDDSFHARVIHAWLVVHDAQAGSGSLALGGALLLVVGPLLTATGLGIVLYGLFSRRKRKAPVPKEPPAEST
ncbi:MAG: hypothetical protein H0W83_05480 [Planctomycetes bacterium]|nr:hypothetical protein [Planctomycetota bacterium]